MSHAKRGRPLLLGQEVDRNVSQYLTSVRQCGGGAKEILMKIDRTRLAEHGGHLNLTRDWAKFLLMRMGFVKRQATTKISKIPVSEYVQMENIPPELIFNWDQTG